MAADKTKHLRQRIEQLFVLADRCDDYEARAELACFAAVLTSGLIEATCRRLLLSYTANRAHGSVLRFVESRLHMFQNAKTTKIQKLFGAFDTAFADRIKETLTKEEEAAIDSVVNNKNALAHGADSGLGLDTMRAYYRAVVTALDKLSAICR